MTYRILVLTICFLAASAYISKAAKTEIVPIRQHLVSVPLQIGAWQGTDAGEFNARTVAALGADDYLNRNYVSNGELAGLYVGFYQSQRQGSSIHSPLNCLPGAGWNPAERSLVTLSVPGTDSNAHRDVQVNQILIEKGLDKQVVLYWYQSHGRVIASEYWGKAYAVWDAMRLNRTDGALVRIISPVRGRDNGAQKAAKDIALNFARDLFPLLSHYLPD